MSTAQLVLAWKWAKAVGGMIAASAVVAFGSMSFSDNKTIATMDVRLTTTEASVKSLQEFNSHVTDLEAKMDVLAQKLDDEKERDAWIAKLHGAPKK